MLLTVLKKDDARFVFLNSLTGIFLVLYVIRHAFKSPGCRCSKGEKLA